MDAAEPSLDLRELSRAAALCALGLLLPIAFHALQLGRVFLPMYLPLLAGAFLLRPRWAAFTAAVTPLVSAVLTGMPALFPPVAAWMAIELGSMAAVASVLHAKRRLPVAVILAVVLVMGRFLYALLVWMTSGLLGLPAGVLSIASLVSAWPGMLLAMVVIPTCIGALKRVQRQQPGAANS